MRVDRKKPEQAKQDPPKIVIVPAIERLEELHRDITRMATHGIAFTNYDAIKKLEDELQLEAINEFTAKWGLTL